MVRPLPPPPPLPLQWDNELAFFVQIMLMVQECFFMDLSSPLPGIGMGPSCSFLSFDEQVSGWLFSSFPQLARRVLEGRGFPFEKDGNRGGAFSVFFAWSYTLPAPSIWPRPPFFSLFSPFPEHLERLFCEGLPSFFDDPFRPTLQKRLRLLFGDMEQALLPPLPLTRCRGWWQHFFLGEVSAISAPFPLFRGWYIFLP